MTAVNVGELFVSWLQAQLPDVHVGSRRPAKLEERLPYIVVQRGGGGDLAPWVDGPIIDVDCYGALPGLGAGSPAMTLAGRVDTLFREQTPVGWRGSQFTMLRCNEGPHEVGDTNTAVTHAVSTYSFSFQ